jgi:hypothetical protein
MFLKDLIHVADRGRVRLMKAGAALAGRDWDDEKSVVEVEGWVRIVCRERGKIVPGTLRDEHNVWTNTGREYLTQCISLRNTTATYRNDAISFVGVGIGTQLEEPGVIKLDQPIAYDQGLFLADIQDTSFPLTPVRTTVEYRRVFIESEVSVSPVTVLVSELGLYTNGNPASLPDPYAFATMNRSWEASKDAAPVAYKTFEPVGKTAAMQLEISWQLRF